MRSFFGNPDYTQVTADLMAEVKRLRTELKVPETEDPSMYGNGGKGQGKKAPGKKSEQ